MGHSKRREHPNSLPTTRSRLENYEKRRRRINNFLSHTRTISIQRKNGPLRLKKLQAPKLPVHVPVVLAVVVTSLAVAAAWPNASSLRAVTPPLWSAFSRRSSAPTKDTTNSTDSELDNDIVLYTII